MSPSWQLSKPIPGPLPESPRAQEDSLLKQLKQVGQAVYRSGVTRSPKENKDDFTLVRDGPLFLRWVKHLNLGANRHAPRNWMLAESMEDLDRFRESAARHFEQWLAGEDDEDHAAAILFNINGAEYVKDRLRGEPIA
jgi:Domain of unknown function (DUF5664)